MILRVPERRVVLAPWVAMPGSPAEPASLGAKAARLRELAKIAPVPPWIVVTTEATRAVLQPVLDEVDRIAVSVPKGDADDARVASEQIERLVRDASWPQGLRDELQKELQRLRVDSGLAVRSSAAWEDGIENSHAGQLATVLHVRAEDVEAAVRTCWASSWTDRAILYRQARGLRASGLAMAVIVQEMVRSRVSGVAFTADPMTGTPVELVIAGYGLGDGVVSDQVETDEFVRRSHGGEWRATVRRKAWRSVPRNDGVPGTELVPVPQEIQDHPAMSSEQLDTLGGYLLRVERAAGRAQDVEWAIDWNGGMFLLQARPITASPDGRIALWDDGNIGESYPGLTLPLTYSYVRLAYERVFTRALREIGVSPKAVEAASPSLAHLVGTIEGRLYLNVLEVYRLYALVPGLEPAVRRWEDAFGVRAGEEALRVGHLSSPTVRQSEPWVRVSVRSCARVRTRSMLALKFLTRSRDVRRLQRDMSAMLHGLEDAPVANLDFDDLLARFEGIQLRCLGRWSLVLFNDLVATYFTDRLAHLCSDGVTDSIAPSSLRDRLLRGETRMESVAPLRSVLALARVARDHPIVVSLVHSGRSDQEIWSEVLSAPELTAFRAMTLDHIRKHGYRVTDELKLEVASLHEEPWTIVSILRNYLRHDFDPEAMTHCDREVREAAEREYRSRFQWNPLRSWYARWILEGTRRSLSDRENLALVRTRAHAQLRRLFRAMGDSLVRNGALCEARDIFYLTIEELRGYARGGLPEGGLGGIVALRRACYAEYRRRKPPHRILCRGPVDRSRIREHRELPASRGADSPGFLRGVPCSAGRVRGIARVLRSASVGDRVDGEILVAPVTDPGWMFLMLAAKGLIVERGSVLSHTAIIGRELGIPTIVAVEGATNRIETGKEIEMDGATGEIRILSGRSSPSQGP